MAMSTSPDDSETVPTPAPDDGATVPTPVRDDGTVPVQGDRPGAPVTVEHAGRYTLRRQQGAGGQGVVNVVFDGVIGREIAFKVLLPRPEASESARSATEARFLREARITGQLEHPGIVPVHEVGRRADGSLYYTQKLVRGRTLRAALRECASMGDRLRLLPHFIDICQAMAYAHDRGVVHRDLKPENVMVGEFGETVVLDWGLAKVLGSAPDPAAAASEPSSPPAREDLFYSLPGSAQTVEGAVFGTPSYMSPEQAQGKTELVDGLSDVWTLGAMLFELLCGRTPFEGSTSSERREKAARQKAPAVAEVQPDAPPELAAIADRALHRERPRRYASARALAQDIEAYLIGGRVGAYDYSFWELLRKLVKKNPLASAAAAAALAVLLVSMALIARAHRSTVSALAETLAMHAASAAAEDSWAPAAVWYAAARAQEERSDARLGEGLAEKMAPRPLLRLAAPGSPALSVVFAGPGQLAATSFDGSLRLWNGAALARTAVAHRGPAWALAASAALLATGGEDGRVRLWTPSLDPVAEWQLPLGPRRPSERAADSGGEGAPGAGVAALAFSPDGASLASGTLGGGVDVWSTSTRKLRLHLALDEAFGVAFGPSGDRLAVAGGDGVVRVFDLSGAERFRLTAHAGRARAVAFSPDGALVASGGQDGQVVLWRPGADEPPRRLEAHQRAVSAVRFSPDGAIVASASRDGLFILWDAATGRMLARTDADERAADGLAFSADGRELAVAHQDESVRVWSMPERRIVGMAGHADQVRAVAFAPDGAALASAGQDGVVRLWNREGRALRSFDGGGKLRAVAFSPDGALLAAGGDGGELRLWNARSGALVRALPGGVGALVFSNRLLAAGGRDGIIRLYDGDKLVSEAQSGHPAIESMATDRTGELLATSGNDGYVRIWSLPSLTLRQDLHAHGEAGRGVAFSPDGALLATGGSDRRLALYDTRSWTLLRDLPGHKGRVHGVAFSPDGRWLASSCSDRTARMFEVASGELIWSSMRHDGPVMDLAWAPDGSALVTAGADRTLELWRFDGIASPPPLADVLRQQWLRLAGQRLEPAHP